jgi:hypothetical protein
MSMAKQKFDGIVEAVRYAPNGQVLWVRAYERRGPTFSDHVLIERQALVELLKAGKRFFAGQRKPYLASEFEVAQPLRLLEQDGKSVLLTGETLCQPGPPGRCADLLSLKNSKTKGCPKRYALGQPFVFSMKYNFLVPTPFYHLSVNEALLRHPALPAGVLRFLDGLALRVPVRLHRPRCPGRLRPNQGRHPFLRPARPPVPAPPWQAMLRQHPGLADPAGLPPAHAAFLAGYLCHLGRLPGCWKSSPGLWSRCAWGSFEQRLYLHNVLRSYLDRRILPEVTGSESCLGRVEPCNWLPFTADAHLRAWRDLLFPQLRPGANVQTVEVFAARQGISAQDYYTLLDSEERMRREVFVHLAPEQVESYRQGLLAENIQLLSDYLAFMSQGQPAIAGEAKQNETH